MIPTFHLGIQKQSSTGFWPLSPPLEGSPLSGLARHESDSLPDLPSRGDAYHLRIGPPSYLDRRRGMGISLEDVLERIFGYDDADVGMTDALPSSSLALVDL
jgi:hypothetical protein